jgi:hypothetical protein
MNIEDIFMRQGYAKQVSSSRMYDSFRLARGARRLQKRRIQKRANSRTSQYLT